MEKIIGVEMTIHDLAKKIQQERGNHQMSDREAEDKAGQRLRLAYAALDNDRFDDEDGIPEGAD